MRAEIILTDNNINIDLNEPAIDVSTEDGISVMIIGGVGPQGNRGPEGPKGEKGDDYVLTEEDKDDIAELASDKVAVPVQDVQVNGVSVLSEGVANVKRATLSTFGVVKASNSYGTQIYGSGSNESIGTYPATSTQIKQGAARYPVIGPFNQHESAFYGLAKAAGDTTQSQSNNAVGSYTDMAKTAIKAMLGIDFTDYVRNTDFATGSIGGVVKVNQGLGVNISLGSLCLTEVNSPTVKGGVNAYKAITPKYQHESAFYGLAKAAGVDMKDSDNAVGVYTDAAKAAIRVMIGAISISEVPAVPVQDVQISGTSIIADGIANVPIANDSTPGVVKVPIDRGLSMTTEGNISLVPAPSSLIKAGEQKYFPIVPKKQHEAVFYGLAKAAGFDEKDSTLPSGQYTEEAQAAIKKLLGVEEGLKVVRLA